MPPVRRANGGDYRDHRYTAILSKALSDEPMPASLADAVAPLRTLGVPVHELIAGQNGIERTRETWQNESPPRLERLDLAGEYREDHALAIYIYTLEFPSVYAVLSRIMVANDRASASGELSQEMRACLAFLKFLCEALACLPERFIFRSAQHHNRKCLRGVKHVFENAANHNPAEWFPEGSYHGWYQLISTSTDRAVMNNAQFCGHDAGPRTIFSINVYLGYDIREFSFYGAEEAEVLLPPLSHFRVVNVSESTCVLIDPNTGQPWQQLTEQQFDLLPAEEKLRRTQVCQPEPRCPIFALTILLSITPLTVHPRLHAERRSPGHCQRRAATSS